LLKSIHTPIACTRLSLVVNVVLFALKLFAGIYGRSQALVADALNSLLDIVANIIVWFGLRIARKPPDREHPYGHGNADTIAAVLVALILVVTGGYIGRESLDSIINHNFRTPTYLATAAALFTIIVKGILYKYTVNIGRRFRSQAVMANAQDHKADVVVSAGTLVGIILAQIEYPILDPIAGLWVAFFILKQAVAILKENFSTLMVSSPDIARQENIKKFISDLDNVVAAKWVKGRQVGTDYYLDSAVMVRGDISVREGHEIAHSIRSAVIDNFPEVADILVHIEPDE